MTARLFMKHPSAGFKGMCSLCLTASYWSKCSNMAKEISEILLCLGSVERKTHWAYVGIHKRGKYVGNKTLVLSVVPSVCRGLCAPNSGLLVSLSQVGPCCATKDVPQFSHLRPDALLAITSGKVTSQSRRLEGTALIVDWMNTSERMKSTMNDPPITIRQCCLALMNTWKLLDGNDESGN